MNVRLYAHLLLITSFVIGIPQLVQAQQRAFEFDVNLEYDASITSPADYLGYEPGEEYSLHSDVVNYFRNLAEQSGRVTIHTYGETYEGRELIIALITSEENQSNIDEIRRNNLRLASPDELGEEAVAELVENQPAVVWLSYNVHGNEASSSEAAMQTAYRLAAGLDSETVRMREETVTIIDPMLNPDGRDRYVFWYKSAKSHILNTDAADYEHDEPWPGGRTNHYWFDLNRDWMWLVHPESQGRIAEYQKWLPQVHLDLHEQGFNNNYFTMPGTTPRNQELPDAYESWADVFGRGTIEEFDRHRISYATREAFDFFYPGYGSSYPSLLGSIGMLAEQGGHSRGGRAVETDDGYVLTLRQRIFDHYVNSIATVRTAMENRGELLGYFSNSFSADSRKGEVEAFILPDDPNGYTYDLIDILLKHGVEVERAADDFTVRNAYNYRTGTASSRAFSEGDFVVRTDQPRHILINTLMKRNLAIDDSVMYDMSTWSAPLAYNLDAAWTERNVDVDLERVTELPSVPAGVENPDARYAFVIDWNQRHAPKALARFWDAGYRVRSAMETFRLNGRTFSRGSLIVLAGRNYGKLDSMREDMARIADEASVEIVGLETGRMDEGMDLASRDSEVIEKPDVALLVDSPFNSYTAGQLWFLFDRWTEFGISRLRSDALDNIDLNEYDVLLIPGSRGSLSSVIDSTMQERLKAWVRSGGTIVATEGSAAFFTENGSGFTDVKMIEEEKEEEHIAGIDPAAYTRYEARRDSSGLRRIPGSGLAASLDDSHPLAFGIGSEVTSLKFSDDALVPTTDWQVAGYYHRDAGQLLVSGYASQENLEKLAGHAFAGVREMGSGKIVFLLDNTQYRMFWVGPARMVQNAVMLLPDM
jgi:hypothetical protein